VTHTRVRRLLAAPFGLIDWFKIPAGTRAKGIGLLHGLGNIVVVVLFAVSWLIRVNNGWEPTVWALVCSFAAVGLAVVTVWMGGELVERSVSGSTRAGVDAPSSLRHRHVAT
jgi:uncharacterized membrane protein